MTCQSEPIPRRLSKSLAGGSLFLSSCYLGCLLAILQRFVLLSQLKFIYDVQVVNVVDGVIFTSGRLFEMRLQSHPQSFAEHLIGVLVPTYSTYTGQASLPANGSNLLPAHPWLCLTQRTCLTAQNSVKKIKCEGKGGGL